MKSFKTFLNEADIRQNPAITPEYLGSLDKRAEQSAREVEQKYGRDMGTRMRAVREVQMLQRGKERQLEELTTSVILSQYGSILGETELDIKIPTDPREMKAKMKETDDDDQDKPNFKEIEDEDTKTAINKRKILNMIAQGEAINSKKMLMGDENMEGLTQLFGEANARKMVELLVTITDICNARDWRIPEEVGAKMIEQGDSLAGISKIEWKPKSKKDNAEDQGQEDGDSEEDTVEETTFPTLVIRGMDQAMLFHESIKAIYGLINQGGMANLDDETIQKVFMNTDTAADEVQDLKRAKLTAADLRDFIQSFEEVFDIENGREYVWGKMIDSTVVSDSDFLELMKLIFTSAPLYRTVGEQEPQYTESEIASAEESFPKAKAIVNNLIRLIKQELADWEDSQSDSSYDEPDFSMPSNDRELDQADIQNMIDIALDNRDFAEVERLSNLLK
jgi:hypothetical protein